MAHSIDSLPCPSTYTRLLLQRWPTAQERILAGTGLSPAQLVHQGVISVSQQLQVLRNARELAAQRPSRELVRVDLHIKGRGVRDNRADGRLRGGHRSRGAAV